MQMLSNWDEPIRRAQQSNDESLYDSLTGAFSRKFFDVYLPEILEIARRDNLSLSVVFAEVNNFDQIRSAFGEAGDRVLPGVVRILERNVRADDVVIRFAEETFLLILPKARPESARGVCDRILKTCSTLALPAGDKIIRVELAMGLVTRGDGIDFESTKDLLGAANLALFKAKLSGIDNFAQYSG